MVGLTGEDADAAPLLLDGVERQDEVVVVLRHANSRELSRTREARLSTCRPDQIWPDLLHQLEVQCHARPRRAHGEDPSAHAEVALLGCALVLPHAV